MINSNKIVAVIPALLDSKRIPEKNLILLDGYPMIYYVVKACKESGVFDEIYINSEARIFKQIADELDVKFMLRHPSKGGSQCNMKNTSSDCKESRCSVHDHYLFNFACNINADFFVQIHTTSPLIEPSTIKNFVNELMNYDSQVSVEETHKESFFNGNTINFNLRKKQPTQTLTPIETISWALSGWNREKFILNYYNGPTFCGRFNTFPISKIEAIDVDTPDDLFIAEACLNHKKRKDSIGKFKYHKNITSIESNLTDLIALDGSPIPSNMVLGHNKTLTNLEKIEKEIGGGDWCYPVVYTENDQIAFIRQTKDNGCRKHYHPTKDEWWVIFRGEFKYELWFDSTETTGKPDEIVYANSGDVVFLPKGTTHVITCVSDEAGIRLACGSKEMAHVYVD